MLWSMSTRERMALWPWIVVVIVAPVVMLVTYGSQVGRCADYTAESGLESFCESGPQVGWPGAILIGVVCVALFVFAVIRLALRSRRRAGGS
jgi:hypothetical protein